MIARRERRSALADVDNRIGWRVAHDDADLVLRYEKPEHALLDDSDALRASGTINFSAGRTR